MHQKSMFKLGILFAMLLALYAFPRQANAQDAGEVVAKDFNGPMGVLVDPDGNIWVIDSGIGGDTEVEMTNPETGKKATAHLGVTARVVKIAKDGTQTEIAKLPSTLIDQTASGGSRLALVNGTLYASVGTWQEYNKDVPAPNTATIVQIAADGTVTEAAKPWQLEKEKNPDGFMVESNPFGLAAAPGNRLYVTDAHGNDLLSINPATGRMGVVAVFPGVPSSVENSNRGGAKEADPVPTGITFDADGNGYISFLTGYPFTQGSASVAKISPDGAQVSTYATGLTSLIDLRVAPDGGLYAVQFAKFGPQGWAPHSGAILRIQEGTASEILVSDLDFPTSIDFNADGDAYLTTNGVGAPGTGELIKLAGLTKMTGTMLPQPGAPAVTVADQTSDGQSVWVDSSVATEPGWMVIHADGGDKPGPVLGETQVISGVNYAIEVKLDKPLESTSKLWAMLHVDAGEVGKYEFPGPDKPVTISDTVVMMPFTATVAAVAAGQAMTETNAMTETHAMSETATMTSTTGTQASDYNAGSKATEANAKAEKAPDVLPQTGASNSHLLINTLPILVIASLILAFAVWNTRRRHA